MRVRVDEAIQSSSHDRSAAAAALSRLRCALACHMAAKSRLDLAAIFFFAPREVPWKEEGGEVATKIQREEMPPGMHDARRDITRLRDSTCRYPLWNELTRSAIAASGGAELAGKPYCNRHAKLCFRP